MSLSWIVEGQLVALAMPWPEDLDDLARSGVRGLISLTERTPAGLPHPGLEHMHLPVRDFTPPSQAQLAEAIAFIDRMHAGGGAAAVHCGAGLGRTGTVIAAWFVRHGWTSADALREVRKKRPGSVETRDQEAAVRRFAKSLGLK